MPYCDQRYVVEVTRRQAFVDLFEHEAFVVTIKTGGRVYGAISQQFSTRYPKTPLPNLSWGDSAPAVLLPDGKYVIFTALWPDQEQGSEAYPPVKVYSCTASAIRQAADAGRDEIALPLIGGSERHNRMPAMGQAIHDALALLEKRSKEIDVVVALGRSGKSIPTGMV